MAVDPKFRGLRLPLGDSAPQLQEAHTLEIYLDYVCPFSKKMFDTIYYSVRPTLTSTYSTRLSVIFRPHIQPWHPSSTLCHEAALAVLRLAPERFWEFSAKLFEHQTEFFDLSVLSETRNQTYERLAYLVKELDIETENANFLKLLKIDPNAAGDSGLNVGNSVTSDVKTIVKAHRLTGVHFTPTVLFNGIIENNISSKFTTEQWMEWLKKNVM